MTTRQEETMPEETRPDVDGCEIDGAVLVDEPIVHLPVATLALDMPAGHRVTAAWYIRELAPTGDELAEMMRYIGRTDPTIDTVHQFMARVADAVRVDAATPQAMELRDAGLRAQVMRRDGDCCRYCSTTVVADSDGDDRRMFDHVFPQIALGAANIVICCRRCWTFKAGSSGHAVVRLLAVPADDDIQSCVSHGRPGCWACAANPSTCDTDDPHAHVGCGSYSATGMHFDSCPNRIDDPSAVMAELPQPPAASPSPARRYFAGYAAQSGPPLT